jgi:hypothetical protein
MVLRRIGIVSREVYTIASSSIMEGMELRLRAVTVYLKKRQTISKENPLMLDLR